jgi:hypothetical protein
MGQFLKKKLLLIIILIGITRGIIMAPYIWDEKPAIKLFVFGVGLLNLTLFLLYNKYIRVNTRPQAALCDTCGLFIPLDMKNDSPQLKPHCCYMKPK